MAKVGEEHLFNLMNLKRFCRLPVSYGRDHFWINVESNSVVKVRDHKLLHTWTLTHPHSFTSPVIFNGEDDTLCCVLDNNTLMKWSIDSDSLKGSLKFKFQENIFAAISIEGQNSLLIFDSGTFLKIDSQFCNSEPKSKRILDSSEELLWADAAMYKSELVVFFLGFDVENNLHKLHNCTVSESTKSTKHCVKNVLHESATLKSWCLNKLNASFLTIWSNGDVVMHDTESQAQTRLLCISVIETNQFLAIDAIDSSHIAVLKCHSKQKESVLEIWDSKFSALKVQKSLKLPFSQHIQVSVLNNNIFLLSNEDLVTVPFHVDKSTLAAAVGKSTIPPSKTAEFSLGESGKLVHLESNSRSSFSLKNKFNTNEQPSDSVESIAKKLVNDSSTYLKYIPESELVKLLLLAVKCKEKEGVMKVNRDADIVLSMVFSASFSDVILVKYLKKLNLEETLITLEILFVFLNGTLYSTNKVCKKPSDLQIFDWTCLLIQSHMEALLFSKDKKVLELLRKFENTVSDKMEEYEEFEGIQSYFYILQKKKNILPIKFEGKYCIEHLDV